MKGLGAGKGWVKPFGVAYLSWLAPFHPFFRPDFGFKGLTGQPCVLQKGFYSHYCEDLVLKELSSTLFGGVAPRNRGGIV